MSSVALETGADGMPRLLIDVRVAENVGADPWRDPSTDFSSDFSSALTPVVEPIIQPPIDAPSPLDAVPQHVWEAADHAVTTALTAADFQDEAPLELSEAVPTPATSSPTLPHVSHLPETPISASMILSIEPPVEAPIIVEGPGASPAFESADETEIVSIERPTTGRWRALGGGALAGAVALAAFVAVIALIRNAPPREAAKLFAPPVTQKAVADELPLVAPPPQPDRAARPLPRLSCRAPPPGALPKLTLPKLPLPPSRRRPISWLASLARSQARVATR